MNIMKHFFFKNNLSRLFFHLRNYPTNKFSIDFSKIKDIPEVYSYKSEYIIASGSKENPLPNTFTDQLPSNLTYENFTFFTLDSKYKYESDDVKFYLLAIKK